jgi:phosphate starvation-inducible PhoH-like protein
VITGDVTQVDLPVGRTSGLTHAQRILSNVEGIHFSHFTDVDVVRHPLVQAVIRAYEKAEVLAQAAREAQSGPAPEPAREGMDKAMAG